MDFFFHPPPTKKKSVYTSANAVKSPGTIFVNVIATIALSIRSCVRYKSCNSTSANGKLVNAFMAENNKTSEIIFIRRVALFFAYIIYIYIYTYVYAYMYVVRIYI